MPRPPKDPLYYRSSVPGSFLKSYKGCGWWPEVNLTLSAKPAYKFPGESEPLNIWQMCIRASDTLRLLDTKDRPSPDYFLVFAAAFIPPNQWLVDEMLAADPRRGGDTCSQRRTAIWPSLGTDLQKICHKAGVKRGTLVRASVAWLLGELTKYVTDPRRKSRRKEFFERFTAGPYRNFPTTEELWEMWLMENAEEWKKQEFRHIEEDWIRIRIAHSGGFWWKVKGNELLTWPINTSHDVMDKKLKPGSWHKLFLVARSEQEVPESRRRFAK